MAAPTATAAPTPTTRLLPAVTPAFGWTVISDDVRPVTNYRFVEVVLDERLSEAELRELAEVIQAESPEHPRIHILYWIERMHYEGRAWATTTFERGRAFDIGIYGLAPDDLAQVLAAPPPDAAEIVGRWLTDQVLAVLGGLSTIYLDAQGTPFIEHRHPDGSVTTHKLVEAPAPGGRRFDYAEVFPRDYLIVKPESAGRLLFYGENGIFAAGVPAALATVHAATPAAAIPTPTATSEPRIEGPDEYVVQPGDTLRSIAERFDTTIELLVEANDIEDPDLIRTGLTLRLPLSTTSAPTSASTSPAATPTPYASPTPTPIPTVAIAEIRSTYPCLTAPEANYVAAVANGLSATGNTFYSLQVVFQRADAAGQPVALTGTHRAAFDAVIEDLRTASETILALPPPDSHRIQETRESAETFARSVSAMADALEEAVDEGSVSKLSTVWTGPGSGVTQDTDALVDVIAKVCE